MVVKGSGGRKGGIEELDEWESSNRSGRHACAACRHQRRKCKPECVMAPYFPADKMDEFLDAHKIFGVSNMTKCLENLQPGDTRKSAADSLKWEAQAWKIDPVNGPLGAYNKKLIKSSHQIDICSTCKLAIHQLQAPSNQNIINSSSSNIDQLLLNHNIHGADHHSNINLLSHYHHHHNLSMAGPRESSAINGCDAPYLHQNIYDPQQSQQQVGMSMLSVGLPVQFPAGSIQQRHVDVVENTSPSPSPSRVVIRDNKQTFYNSNYFHGTSTSSSNCNNSHGGPIILYQNPPVGQLLRQPPINNVLPPHQFHPPPPPPQ